ncbi:MAG: hypothetical protein ABII95_02950 [Patescibacteria group bacterium]
MEYKYYNQINHCLANLTVGGFGISVMKQDINHFIWPRRCLFM